MKVPRNVALLVVAVFAGCSSTSNDADLVGAVRAAMNHVDVKRVAIVVADDALNSLLREAVGKQQRVVTSAEIPKDVAAALPAKWMRIQEAKLTEKGQAFVRVIAGPVPGPPPAGVVLLDCGTIYGMRLKQDAAGVWSVDNVSVAMC
jgi:hypothetical protein